MISTVTSEGWKGEGTAEAPFIIEDYTIDGVGEDHCIYIANTTYHVGIRNMPVRSSSKTVQTSSSSISPFSAPRTG
jgi:hypothetical protein